VHVPLYIGDLEADLKMVSANQLAEKITGGLSITSKMPCPSWGLPATRCKIGSLLARKEGTVCHSCYARKGRYAFPAVKRKLEERYRGIFHELWTPSMVFLIRWYTERYFRWMDSGDVADANHLRNICTIAEHTPDILHWLPTREVDAVRAVTPPENLVIRVSAQNIDGELPDFEHTSGVVTEGETCKGVCGKECRLCWDRAVKHVSYRLH
jgi:hypothetical protein